MSATYYEDEGVTVCISDEGMRRLANEAAAKAQSARRNEITCAVLAAAVTFFAVVELIKQSGVMQ